MKTIKLLGRLGKRFGREWRLAVESPAEAIRAIAANKPEITDYLNKSEENGVGYKVLTPKQIFNQERLHSEFDEEVLIISPQVIGAGGNFGKILLGVTLVATSFLIPGSIGVLGMSISSSSLGLMGVALVGSGLSNMMASTPETPGSNREKQESFLFKNAERVTDQGRPVPIVYGEYTVTDPVVISSSIDTDQRL